MQLYKFPQNFDGPNILNIKNLIFLTLTVFVELKVKAERIEIIFREVCC